MNNNQFKTANLLTPDTVNLFTGLWKRSLPEKNSNLFVQQTALELVDNRNWMALNVDELFDQCLIWKQEFLGARNDKNSGSLEWLICVLRHNATNYDEILKLSANNHAWAPGFSSLLRLQADYLIILYLRQNNFYDKLIKKCQEEWMWRNRSK